MAAKAKLARAQYSEMSARMGRLDVAAVLASLYPAGTILLAAGLLHEKTNTRQRIGMVMALPAVVLVTL